MLRSIFLYGTLEEQFGKEWKLEVDSVREAVRAIDANTGGKFREVIRDMDLSVVRGEDMETGEPLGMIETEINYGRGDFHICPSVAGSAEWVVVGIMLVIAAAAVVLGPKIFPFNPPNDKDGDEDNTTADMFGVINSANQGQVIPLIYGEVYTGSVVISQGLKAIEVI
jgi:predicted phage tail protein